MSIRTLKTATWSLLCVIAGVLFAKIIHGRSRPPDFTKSNVASSEYVQPSKPNWTETELDKLRTLLQQQSAEIETLQASSAKLANETVDNERVRFYRILEPVLLQLPVISADARAGRINSPMEIASVLDEIPIRLKAVGLEAFGTVEEIEPFDPQVHMRVTGTRVSPGAMIRILTPGFRYNGVILRRAEIEAAD